MAGNINWTDEFFLNWREQFRNEHGYYPEDDPNLAEKGLSPKQRLREHMRAAEWGAQFAAKEGRPPTQWEWENQWYKRQYGFDPREIWRFVGSGRPRPPRRREPEPFVVIPKFGI